MTDVSASTYQPVRISCRKSCGSGKGTGVSLGGASTELRGGDEGQSEGGGLPRRTGRRRTAAGRLREGIPGSDDLRDVGPFPREPRPCRRRSRGPTRRGPTSPWRRGGGPFGDLFLPGFPRPDPVGRSDPGPVGFGQLSNVGAFSRGVEREGRGGSTGSWGSRERTPIRIRGTPRPDSGSRGSRRSVGSASLLLAPTTAFTGRVDWRLESDQLESAPNGVRSAAARVRGRRPPRAGTSGGPAPGRKPRRSP